MKIQKNITLKTAILTVIVLAGLSVAGLIHFTETEYRQLVLKHHSDELKNLLAIKSRDLTNELIQNHKEMGFVLQSESYFKKAFNNKNINNLNYWLDQEFDRYFANTGIIKLEKLIIYDKKFDLITRSGRGLAMGKLDEAPCPLLVNHMKQLSTPKRLKPHSELCLYDNKPLLSTIVSIGSLNPKGYIQIVSDPTYILANLDKELGVELKISAYDDTVLHQSGGWPKDDTLIEENLFSEYTIQTSDDKHILAITGATNIKDLYSRLDTRRQTTLITLFIMVISIFFLIRFIIDKSIGPLKTLQNDLTNITENNFSPIKENGLYETSKTIKLFNNMIYKFRSKINLLESNIQKHEAIEIELRDTVNLTKEHASISEQKKLALTTTFQSIVDGIITTDTSGHVTYINPMAEKLTGWSMDDARNVHLSKVAHLIKEKSCEDVACGIEEINNISTYNETCRANLVQNGNSIETAVEYTITPIADGNKTTGFVIVIHDMSSQRSLNRHLAFQASLDTLTGLMNRYEFERTLKHLVHENRELTTSNILLYIELDQLREINNTYGHTAGDELLKQIATLIKKHIDASSTLARLGNSDFGLLIHDCDTEHAEHTSYQIQQAIEKYSFNWNDNNITINSNIGIVEITSSQQSVNELLDDAISACRRSKELGRNCAHIYKSENDKLLTQQREMHWVSRINHAIEEDRFQLYFQKILPLNNTSNEFINHGEILLRMTDKKGDLISPDLFLPAAERYNMITTIDEWVTDKTFKWQTTLDQKILTSINVSGKSISDKDFTSLIVSKIKKSKINPGLLCFEINEVSAINHLTNAIHFMTTLKKLGCSFALDNFGSGHSSFSYLENLPVDYLKIDGSFIKDIDKDPIHYAMVKAIYDTGQAMGIKTIAEYATSEKVVECLRDIGIDYAQGYAVAKPVPLSSYDKDENNDQSIFKKS